MYITEQEFDIVVRKYTGKELGKDYGFVTGTMHPLGYYKRMLSATNREGFMIWKKNTNDKGEASYTEKWITKPEDWKEPVRETISFLNDTTFKIKLTRDNTNISGEYNNTKNQ